MATSGGRWWQWAGVAAALVGAGIVLSLVGERRSPLVVGAICGLGGAWLAGWWQRNPDSWLWRHGRVSADEFDVAITPTELRARADDVVSRRRWRIAASDGTSLDVYIRATWWQGSKRVRIEYQPTTAGTRVHVVARTPSLWDGGAGKRFVCRLRDELDQGRGADDSSQDTKPV